VAKPDVAKKAPKPAQAISIQVQAGAALAKAFCDVMGAGQDTLFLAGCCAQTFEQIAFYQRLHLPP